MAGSGNLNVQLRIRGDTADTIRRLARERNTTQAGLFLQALGILHAVHEARKEGKHVGIATHRDDLETVLLDAVI